MHVHRAAVIAKIPLRLCWPVTTEFHVSLPITYFLILHKMNGDSMAEVGEAAISHHSHVVPMRRKLLP